MKKASIVLSALGVTVAVSTALAHTSSLGNLYCIALQLNEDGVYTIIPYKQGVTNLMCTVVGAVAATIDDSPVNPYTAYGFLKTTNPTQPCQSPPPTGCPRIKAVAE